MEPKPKIEVKDLSFYYGQNQVLKKINLNIFEKRVTAIIGPSGCGKTTLIRMFNRMNDLVPIGRLEGVILLDKKDINDCKTDVVEIRRRVGMVFQKPNPFPKSIFDNVSYGLEVNGIRDRRKKEEIVIQSLKKAAIWEEVKDRLNESALGLSGGQQQPLYCSLSGSCSRGII